MNQMSECLRYLGNILIIRVPENATKMENFSLAIAL
jgi:hypothetical protein